MISLTNEDIPQSTKYPDEIPTVSEMRPDGFSKSSSYSNNYADSKSSCRFRRYQKIQSKGMKPFPSGIK